MELWPRDLAGLKKKLVGENKEPAEPLSPLVMPSEDTESTEPLSPLVVPSEDTESTEPLSPLVMPSEDTESTEPLSPLVTPSEDTESTEPLSPLVVPSEDTESTEPLSPLDVPSEDTESTEPLSPLVMPSEDTESTEPLSPPVVPSEESHQESSMELNNSTQGDVLERLAEAEKLVVELKYIISQKDAQLQQKDEALQHDKNSTEEEMKVEEIKRELQEKEKLISHLQAQLHQAQSEQAVKASPETSISIDGSQNLVYETELLRAQLNDSLKEIHQKELRIQQLNSKGTCAVSFSQHRLEQSEWDSTRTPIIGACGAQETSVLIDIPGSSCRRTRSGAGWKRVLRSLCHSRNQVPLLETVYFLMVHVLLTLCFTGRL
ncbi:Golgin subfamily B member 1 [Microtus ochrogaster]|uniref:Golgin subfamily B member 1 n=1 Tax=Microtus ochrogaster TaxID=79684 RepID=A0A8J6FYZ0_MICOH|nr:Golgin subfamily B member 1 [Microtus ochrogaster]